MHFCRICRTEKNLKYTVKELRKFSRKRSDDRLLCTTPTLGNICHDCEERLHNFHRLDEHEDNEERIIVDDDELLYNLFFEKVEQQRLMKRLIAVGGGGGGGEWCTTTLRQQTLVAATAGVAVNGIDEVIEVLTSRENTPSPALPVASPPGGALQSTANMQTSRFQKDDNVTTIIRNEKTSAYNTTTEIATSITSTARVKNFVSPVIDNSSSYKVVAVINLDDDEETPQVEVGTSALLIPQTTPDTDEEEIVFRKVEPEDIKKPKNKRRLKKNSRKGNYQNRQINLIASLSLVSSDDDSQVEVTDPECSPEKANVAPKPVDDESASATQLSPVIKLNVSSQQNDSLDAGVKCPVCQTDFSTSQRLIHHMRRKHRTYDGEVLSERPRCAQDSAMTIRLRYMQRYTYYECQLCGSIDAIFKTHKEHVMQQHAEESKSLKDPMMQSLKCPACKEKCGTQHMSLLQHMLQSHKAAECRSHFRQVTHVRNLFSNCGARKEKELHRTARIYQITKRKQYFFECLQCQKIVTGYFNHMKHQNIHNKLGKKNNLSPNASQNDSSPKAKSTPESAPRRAKQNSTESRVKCEKTRPVLTAKEPLAKKKLSSPQPNTVPKNMQSSQTRRERKLTKKAIQAALVKVKVKPPLKQLPTHRYKCKLCIESFEGFHRLNLHILSEHASSDGHLRCNVCLLRFSSNYELNNHERKRHFGKQKRKYARGSETEKRQTFSGTNCVTASTKRHRQSSVSNRIDPALPDPKLGEIENFVVDKYATTNAIWLKDLLVLADQKQFNITNTANNNNNKNCSRALPQCVEYKNCQQEHPLEEEMKSNVPSIFASQMCAYCAHLFSSASELCTHEKTHAQRQEAKKINRCQFDNFSAIPASR